MSANPNRTHPILRATIPEGGRELTVAERRALRNSAVLVQPGTHVVRESGDPTGTHGELDDCRCNTVRPRGEPLGVRVCLDRKARIEFEKTSKAAQRVGL